jgi:hypothetical protein
MDFLPMFHSFPQVLGTVLNSCKVKPGPLGDPLSCPTAIINNLSQTLLLIDDNPLVFVPTLA